MSLPSLPSGRVLRRFTPEELLASPGEARRCVVGFGGWVLGAVVLLVAALTKQWAIAIAACLIGMPSVLMMIGLGADVAARLFPVGLTASERYILLSRLGQEWGRPSVLRRAILLLRE